ncbi:hypothetical protein Tco_1499392 [Tanacetum coccineum]
MYLRWLDSSPPLGRFKKKSVKRIVEKRVAKAIEEYEKTRADSNNTGVVGLKRWFEKMEQVFEICKCAEDDKVKSPGASLSYDDYLILPSQTEIQKVCSKSLGLLTLKGDDIEAYNNRFHELVLMCPELVSTEKKKIEKYIRGFPEGIKGNVTSSKPAEICMIAYQHGSCKAHHQPGPCPPRCGKCHKLGHQEGDCQTRIPVARDNSLQNVTAFRLWVGIMGTSGSDCLEF